MVDDNSTSSSHINERNAVVVEEATAISLEVNLNYCTMSSRNTCPVAEVADTDYDDPNGPSTANAQSSKRDETRDEGSVVVVDGAGDDGDNKNDATIATGRKMCKALTNITMILFFVLGVVSDLEVGFYQEPGFQKFIALPEYNPVPGILCMFCGMITGALIALLLLIKLVPERRIMITSTLQFIGAIFLWVLPKPYINLLVGSFVMMMGMVAQQVCLKCMDHIRNV